MATLTKYGWRSDEWKEDRMTVTTPDPRPSFTSLLEVVGELLASTDSKDFDNPTPCSEFDVAALQDHMVFVLKRVVAIGNGLHFSTEEQEKLPQDWPEQWATTATQVQSAWADDAKLSEMFDVPWGSIQGFAALFTYTAELAVHAWDLTKATGRELKADHIDFDGALMAAQMVPAEGRESDEMPFDPPQETKPDAPMPEKIAAWFGRDPEWAGSTDS